MKALLCTLSVCSAFQVPLGKPHLDRTAAAPLIPAGLAWMPTAAHAMDFNELSSWGEKPLIVDGPGGFEVNPLCYNCEGTRMAVRSVFFSEISAGSLERVHSRLQPLHPRLQPLHSRLHSRHASGRQSAPTTNSLRP